MEIRNSKFEVLIFDFQFILLEVRSDDWKEIACFSAGSDLEFQQRGSGRSFDLPFTEYRGIGRIGDLILLQCTTYRTGKKRMRGKCCLL